MKKLSYLLFLAIGVTACSVESIDSTENLLTADAKFQILNTVTISGPEGVEVFCEGETYTFSLNASTTKATQVQQYDEVAGDWIQVFKSNDGVQGDVYFDVVVALGNNKFRTVIAGEGQTVYPKTFEGVVCTPCEDSLEAVLTCGEVNTLTVTFTATEAGPIVIQGGLNAKAQIQTSNAVGVEETTKPGAGGNASVTRWEGNLEACQEVSITINFIGGNEVGSWTAKRNEVELGASEDQACSKQ